MLTCVWLLSRPWHQHLVDVMVPGASSAFGMFKMECVVPPYSTIAEKYSAWRSPRMIASFFLLVSKMYYLDNKSRYRKWQLGNTWYFQCPAGGFSDPVIALWDSDTFQLLSSIDVSGPIHDASFSPSAANQLTCVGSHGVYFCFVNTCGSDVELRVNERRTTIFIWQGCIWAEICATRN